MPTSAIQSGCAWPGRSVASTTRRPSCSTTATRRWASASARCGRPTGSRSRRRCRRNGRASASTCSGSATARPRCGPAAARCRGSTPRRTAPASMRCWSTRAGRRAARPARRAGLQRPVRPARAAVRVARAGGARPLPDRPLRPGGLGSVPRLRRAAPARGRLGERARPSLGRRLLAELNRFCNVWASDDRSSWDQARAILADLLAPPQRLARAPSSRRSATRHIDTAWLWPLAETLPQGGAHVQLAAGYMDRYPEYRFACSQAQQYDWIRRRNPELYGRIREHVARGRWVPVGGTWVEPDCNLPCGESLVRQFLHGQRFFEREFGRRCREFWNPDVFGYNGQLPQIMRGAGIDRFLTQKLSWNRFNPPPHHTFTWQGIDGSRVLAHFPPADTYNATAEVAELRRNARKYKDHDRSRPQPAACSAGATAAAARPGDARDACAGSGDLQGVPRTEIAHQRPVLRRARGRCRRAARPSSGELYFEYHRGTYTSQARGQARQPRAASGCCTTPSCCARWPPAQAAPLIPASELDRAVAAAAAEPVPRHPARDSASPRCTPTPPATMPRSPRAPSRLAEDALAALAGTGDAVTPVNTIGAVRARGGRAARPRPGVGGGPRIRLRCGRRAGRRGHRARGRRPVVLDNGLVRAELGGDGLLHSLVELSSGRESLSAPGNLLQLYDDRPTAYDAWDVDPFHLETVADAPPASAARSRAPARCGPRWPSSARPGRPARCARPSASTPGRAASSSTARSTGASRRRC